ncbi:hypothetical protein EDM49_14650, partial [Staphylococcus aureus]
YLFVCGALYFYYIGTTSSFESVYFRRATRINTKMRYPFDFIVYLFVCGALYFYYIGTTSSFESVYFRRATRINT